MGKVNYYKNIICVLKQLKVSRPTFNIGRHISTALDGYGDLWNVTDKEFLLALKKYQNEQTLDGLHNEDYSQIINEGMHLETILEEENDFYDENEED